MGRRAKALRGLSSPEAWLVLCSGMQGEVPRSQTWLQPCSAPSLTVTLGTPLTCTCCPGRHLRDAGGNDRSHLLGRCEEWSGV